MKNKQLTSDLRSLLVNLQFLCKYSKHKLFLNVKNKFFECIDYEQLEFSKQNLI